MNEKLKAVYYCRVSTDDENQVSSIVNQKEECIKTISDNNWDLIDSYIDEGKSGTTTKKRDEYIVCSAIWKQTSLILLS